MKVLVLGATGFIGAEVVRQCQAAGIEVVATSRTAAPGVATCDITDFHQVVSFLNISEVTAVINSVGAGATAGSATDAEIWQVNALGTRTLTDAISSVDSSNRPRLIHLGSSRESHGSLSGNEKGATSETYASSKKESADLIKAFRQRGNYALNLRVHNTYGTQQPAGRMLATLVRSAVTKEPTSLRNPNQVHDFVHVGDVAAAVINAAQSDAASTSSIEIGTGAGTSVLELARMVYALAEAPQELISFDENAPAGEPEVADISAAKEILGWQPRVDLMAGLREMVVAARSQTSLEVGGGVMSVRAPR